MSKAGQKSYGPKLAVNAAGDVAIVWSRAAAKSKTMAALRPAGGSFGTPVQISADGAATYDPSIAIDPTGDVTAVWLQYDNATGSLARVMAAGRPAGGAFDSGQPISDGAYDSSYPDVKMDGSGNAIAIWSVDSLTSTSGSESIAAALQPAGGSFGAPQSIVDLAAGHRADAPLWL